MVCVHRCVYVFICVDVDMWNVVSVSEWLCPCGEVHVCACKYVSMCVLMHVVNW